ncbi:MAG: outer membrane protein transport protein [Myxococcales bacterium]|nr:outer membrane protein transport protein [Myxococcales bacterium]
MNRLGFRLVPLLLVLLAPALAHAGGFYLAPRGVRPLSRGGAYVAGVEDPHANWYNPAGLAYSGDQILIDANLTLFQAWFQRVDSGGTVQPEVNGYHSYLPIPTIGGSFGFDDIPELTFSLGVAAPNSVLAEWPQAADAAQRYSILSMQGSLLATVNAGVAWRPIRELSIGLAGHMLIGSFDATVALSACDGVICSFPEDPEYDAISNIALPSVFPFFVLGAIVDLDVVRIGFSVATPFNLEGNARVRVRPPPAAAFQGAEVVNRRPGCNWMDESDPCRDDTVASAQLEFPWVFRLGVEVRPIQDLRIELAAVYETWSVQDAARIDPQDTWIQNALGGGLEYQVGPLDIPRNMNDTISVRLGGQYRFTDFLTVLLGVSYENGAFADEWLTPLTIDSDKVIVSGGAAIDVSPEVSIDVNVGYAWLAPRNVTNSMVPQANPIRPPGSEDFRVFVGNGTYQTSAPFFGLGMRWRLDAGHVPYSTPEEAEPADETVEPEPTPEPTPEPETGGSAPATDGAADGETPWYLRGQDQGAEPEPEATPEPEPEPETRETPRQRRRRLQRERQRRRRR